MLENKTERYFDVKRLRLAAAICVIFTFFIAVINSGRHVSFVYAYTTPIVFSVVGCSFLNGDYLKKKRYVIFMLFWVWFIVCRWLCGDFFMMNTDQLLVAMLGYVILLALPFACVMGDVSTRKYLDIISWVVVIGYAVIFAPVYIGHFRGEQVVLLEGVLEFGSEIRDGSLFIKLCASDDYVTDYLASACLLICMYLTASSWSKSKMLSALSLCLAVYFSIAVILIPCRNVLVGICGALLLVLLIFLQRLRIPKKLIWLVFVLCCVAGAAFVLLGSDHIYAAVANNSRSALQRLKVLSGRTWAWSAAFKVLKEEPIGLLHGFPVEAYMFKVFKYDDQGLGHIHNGFMEALLLTGIPGVLAALAFSVKLIVSSVRIFFSRSAEVLTAHKMMVVAVAAIFFMNIFDSLIFINRTNTDLMFFFFALFAGYIFEMEDILKEQRK